ncbi:MAG: cystathionine gamma-synthase [Spirochaetes bacterium GWF1_31_7]|nr:MAG: cystathionine gamma-synthase [Spirochaetes bacterium GWE1_32_154]OHD51148.1 MAG: cystathionine gamma-synthase [Spirochaetes bacterium GWE2_31_10]OHD52067.1 MAG: cystathionine gamma-synthase [Spirochaetes bacterium GWF1_31_7]
MNYDTIILHNGNEIDKKTGGLSIPVYNASTFAINHVEGEPVYEYSRSGNPTRDALENTIAALENGFRGFAYPSGIAAITTVLLSFLKTGDHAVFPADIYGGTFRFITKVLPDFGIDYTFVDMSNALNVETALKPNTKVIYLETPSNPLLKITSIKQVVAIAKRNSILSIIDNTFMSPYFCKPLDLGVDISIHSATKFLGGHSDLIAGVASSKDETICKRLKFTQNTYGSILSPDDSWLLLRGIKTLGARMKQQTENAIQLAHKLCNVSWIKTVYYPGLSSHPGHEICKDECSGFGAVLSILIDNEDKMETIMKKVKLWSTAVSLGGVESILSYPWTMSHGSLPTEEKLKRGITRSLIRLSVGLESPDDLFNDLVTLF